MPLAMFLIWEDLGIAAGKTTDLLPRPAPDAFYIYFSILFSIRSFFFLVQIALMFNVLVVVGFVFIICKILLRYLLMPMPKHRHDDAAKDYELLRLNMEDYLCMSSKPTRSDLGLAAEREFFQFLSRSCGLSSGCSLRLL